MDAICLCPICNGTLIIATAGPDENGQYDTDDCPCQTVPENERREP
jgi:hypothetical protein